jgi:dTDP-4-dehydrorhamnose reductase
MKILISGVSGLLGSNLSAYLKSKGEEVFGSCRSCENGCQCDFTNREKVFELLDRTSPDVIVNLVALVNVDECEKNPNKAFLVNVRVAENIAQWVIRNGKKTKLVHISTDHVYNKTGYHKEEEIELINTYAISKYQSELAILEADGVVLRTNFFGFHRIDREKGFLAYIVKNLKTCTHFYVSTNVKFNPLSVNTFCENIYNAIKNPVKGVFNVGCKDSMTKGEFVEELCRINNFDPKYMISDNSPVIDNKSVRPADMRMDCSLFEKTYGVSMPNIKDEIKKVFDNA